MKQEIIRQLICAELNGDNCNHKWKKIKRTDASIGFIIWWECKKCTSEIKVKYTY